MKTEKNRIYGYLKKGILLFTMLAVVGVPLLWNTAGKVQAQYIFFMTEASRGGTVTIEPVKGIAANGYYRLEGYQVTYTITNASWNAFDGNYGGFFYMGDHLNTKGGCSFAYAPSGTIQEAGAIQLGCLADGTLIARGDVTEGTASCTFRVSSLDELPAYIAYCYHPASGAYLHITEEYGQSYHVWYYQKLAGTTVSSMSRIDIDGPDVTTGITPIGEAIERNGKTWSKEVAVNATAKDVKSGTERICFYQNGILKKEITNRDQSVSMDASYAVTDNGTFQVQAYDRLGNKSSKKNVTISGIDNHAPVINMLSADDTEYCLENKITVETYDAGVGLADFAYSWNGGEWTDLSAFVAKENGIYALKVRDALGNETEDRIKINNIDNKPPVIKSLKENKTTAGEVQVVVTAADNDGGIGLHEKPYSFDGGRTWQVEPYKTVDENGTYQVLVRDALESYAEAEIEISSFKEQIIPEQPIEPSEPGTPVQPNVPTTPTTPITSTTPIIPDETEGTDVSDALNDADIAGIKVKSETFVPRVKKNTVVVENEEIMSEVDEEVVESILMPQPIKSNSVPNAVLAVLVVLFIAGFIGLLLYLLLFWLRYSCVLYGIDYKQESVRICRLRVRRCDTDWQVQIPYDKLGDQGTGKYVLAFHPSFVKEEIPAVVIVVIDDRSLREDLAEEIVFQI